MRVVLTDGTEFSCKNFRAIESGVLLTTDKKRKKVVGFVPTHQVRYVVPDDLEPVATPPTTGEAAAVSPTTVPDTPPDPPSDDLSIGSTTPTASTETGSVEVRPAGAVDRAASELRRLGGLGSTYAERLQAAGYETLADLAAADPVAVAEAASVAPGRGRRWVDAAGRAVDTEADEPESVTGDGDSGDSEADDSDDAETDA
jgi:predicted flap endonuclease-1-like 5' DNA nuclease